MKAAPLTNQVAEQLYFRILYEGSVCVVEPHELNDSLPGNCVVQPVYMTREKFEALPEFGGW